MATEVEPIYQNTSGAGSLCHIPSGPFRDKEEPIPTTISTIAVQSGNTRIVVALLQDKEWPQLKVQEMSPGMTEIGTTLEEAMLFRHHQEEVLNKLQTKQSPVEKLLNSADELVANQGNKPQVYSAMAENLALAWRALNNQLQQRLTLLDQAVAFYSRCREFSNRMDKGQLEFGEVELPNDYEACLQIFKRIIEMKKAILEGSMFSMNEEQVLLELLRDIKHQNLGDSRPGQLVASVNKTKNLVETHLETLQERRRQMEIMFNMRKSQVDKRLKQLNLRKELSQIHLWLLTTGDEYLNELDLGESSTRIEMLLYHGKQVEVEANECKGKIIKLAKKAEVEECTQEKDKAYALLEEFAEYLASFEQRRELLNLAALFFDKVQATFNKLDQLEINLKTWDPSSHEAIFNMEEAIKEATEETLKDGKDLLEMAGFSSGTSGVKKKVDEVERRRNALLKLVKAQKTKSNEVTEMFYQKFEVLYNWLQNFALKFLIDNRNMGTSFMTSKEFHEKHVKLLNDMQSKSVEINALFTIVPKAILGGGQRAGEVQVNSDKFRSDWTELHTLLENRVQLSQRYFAFHRIFDQIMRDIEDIIRKLNAETISEPLMKEVNERSIYIQQESYKLSNAGRNFIQDAKENTEPYLDREGAIHCTEALLKEFEKRRSVISEATNAHQNKLNVDRQHLLQWETLINETNKVFYKINLLEEKLYPIIPFHMKDNFLIKQHLQDRKGYSFCSIQDLKTELNSRKAALESTDLPIELSTEKQAIVSKVDEGIYTLLKKEQDYKCLLEMMHSFFEHVVEVQSILHNQDVLIKAVPQSNYDTKDLGKEFDRAKAAVNEIVKLSSSEADQLQLKINEMEPEDVADIDREKVVPLLASLRRECDQFWENYRKILDQYKQLWDFNCDLKQINEQIDELSIQLTSLRGNYGDSLQPAKATSQAFKQFEKTIEMLELKMKMFISTSERMLRDQHMDSSHIQNEMVNLQRKWSTFNMNVGENRRLINLTIQYFEFIEDATEWLNNGDKLGARIACYNSLNDNRNLRNELTNYLTQGERDQEDRLRVISELSVEIFGAHENPYPLTLLMKRNQDFLSTFHMNINVVDEKIRNEEMRIRNEEERLRREEEAKLFNEREKIRKEEERLRKEEERLRKEDERMRNEEVEREMMRKKREEMERKRIELEKAMEEAKERERQRKLKEKEEEKKRKRKEEEERAKEKAKQLILVEESFEKETTLKTEARPFTVVKTQKEMIRPEEEPLPFPKEPRFVAPLVDMEVDEGSRVTFSCRVEGFPKPHIYWFKDGIKVENNPDYKTTQGADGSCTLTIDETFNEDSAVFTCRAINGAASCETHGRLTVKETDRHEELIPPHFITDLQPVMAKVGISSQLECHVGGHPLPLVSWFKNDLCIHNMSDYKITNEKGYCVLTVPKVTFDDDGNFTVRASNRAGQVASTAKFTVLPDIPCEEPSFVIPLRDTVSKAGQPLQLNCELKGSPTPEVYWLHDNKYVKEGKTTFDGTKASLMIPEAYPKDGGLYALVAKNIAGEASSSCNVVVKGRLHMETSDSDTEGIRPKVMQHLKDQVVNEGDSVLMDCIIVGEPEPEVIWYHDNKPVKECHLVQLTFEDDRCLLSISRALPSKSGSYKCVAVNAAGEASSHCKLTVNATKPAEPSFVSSTQVKLSTVHDKAPRFTKPLTDVYVKEQNTLFLSVSVSGKPAPKIVWFRNDVEILCSLVQDMDQMGDMESRTYTLTIAEARPEHGGVYAVEATNRAGEAKCYSGVTVEEEKHVQEEIPPAFVKTLDDIYIKSDCPLLLECQVKGTPRPDIQWYFNDQPIHLIDLPELKMKHEADNCSLLIPKVNPNLSGIYKIVAENNVGKAVSVSKVAIEPGVEPTRARSPRPPATDTTSTLRPVAVQGVIAVGSRPITPLLDPELVAKTSQTLDNFATTLTATTMRKTVVHSSKKTSSVRTSDGSNQPLSFQFHQVSAKEEHGFKKLGDQQPEEYHFAEKDETRDAGVHPIVVKIGLQPVHQSDDAFKPIAPYFTTRLTSTILKPGSIYEFEVEIKATPKPTVNWYRNASMVVNSHDLQVTNDRDVYRLTIRKVTPEDGCLLSVRAKNVAGEAESSAQVQVENPSASHSPEKQVQAVFVDESSTVGDKRKFFAKKIAEQQQTQTSTWSSAGSWSSKLCENLTELSSDDSSQCYRQETKVGPPVAPKPMRGMSFSPTFTPIAALHQDTRCMSMTPPPFPSKFKPQLEPRPDSACAFIREPEGSFQVKPAVWSPRGTSSKPLQWRPVRLSHENLLQQQQQQIFSPGSRNTATLPSMRSKPSLDRFCSLPYPSAAALVSPPLSLTSSPEVSFNFIGSNPTGAPIFTTPLKDVKVCEGSYVELECVVDAFPSPSIVWFHGENQVMSGGHHKFTTLSGGICRLIVSEVYPESGGRYTCSAANCTGKTYTSALLTVDSKPIKRVNQIKSRLNVQ